MIPFIRTPRTDLLIYGDRNHLGAEGSWWLEFSKGMEMLFFGWGGGYMGVQNYQSTLNGATEICTLFVLLLYIHICIFMYMCV